MALGTNMVTGADIDVMRPLVWGQRLNDFLKEELILGSFFTDRSDELTDGGDTLHTPNLTAMASATKTNGSQITLVSPTETKVDLVVDTWQEVSFIIEDRELAQIKKSYNLQERYVKNAAFSIGQKLETALAALFSAFSQSVGASTTNLADSEIRQAIAYLEVAKVNVYGGDTAFFLHPNTFWLQAQALDKFSLSQNSSSNDPSSKQPAGFLYGIPVHRTPNCPVVSGSDGRYNALAHKDALHWARLSLPATGNSFIGDMGVRMQTNYVPEYLGFLSTADMVYGVIENRDVAGVRILTHATKA